MIKMMPYHLILKSFDKTEKVSSGAVFSKKTEDSNL